jgi:hypothetical protein
MTTAQAISELMTVWNRVYNTITILNPTWTADRVYDATAAVIRDQLGI